MQNSLKHSVFLASLTDSEVEVLHIINFLIDFMPSDNKFWNDN